MPTEDVWERERITLEPGQFISKLDDLAAKSSVSKKTIRNVLSFLKNVDFLALETARSGILVTVVNWTLYQCEDEAKGTTSGTQGARKGHDFLLYKNDKKYKKQFGDHVFLAPEEHEALIHRFGDTMTQLYIDRLDGWSYDNPKEFAKKSSHYRTILNWHNRDKAEGKLPRGQPQLTDYTGLAAKERAECEQIRANRGN